MKNVNIDSDSREKYTIRMSDVDNIGPLILTRAFFSRIIPACNVRGCGLHWDYFASICPTFPPGYSTSSRCAKSVTRTHVDNVVCGRMNTGLRARMSDVRRSLALACTHVSMSRTRSYLTRITAALGSCLLINSRY